MCITPEEREWGFAPNLKIIHSQIISILYNAVQDHLFWKRTANLAVSVSKKSPSWPKFRKHRIGLRSKVRDGGSGLNNEQSFVKS